ncbi:hypothetical protein BGX23_003661 [Mortierella sp. AD031]|nr:hypothetical protein BGX23_003661 [Mortierella sp. AD031]
MRQQRSGHDVDTQSAKRSAPSIASLLPLILVTTSSILSTTVSAQAQPPASVCCMSYASIDESTLYIQGGFTSVGTVRTQVDQFIALDLSVSTWSTSNPPWMTPPYSVGTPPNSSWHSMSVSKDHTNLYFWDPFNTGWSTFNFAKRTWANFTLPPGTTNRIGIKSGVDYNTGIVYVPAAFANGTQMIVNSVGTGYLNPSVMPTTLMPAPIYHETFVWSSVRGTFLHYGGKTMFGTESGNPYLNEFSPTVGWSRVQTTGPTPGDISGHCMVPAYNGTKMVVFGGTDLHENSSGNIYILDVQSRRWEAGKPVNPNQARCNMACAVAGDSFVAWGGDNKRVNMDATPIVYNLKTGEWTTQFYRVTPDGGSLPAPTPGAQGGSNIAAIAGGAAGGIVLGGIVAFLLIRRRRQNNAKGHAGTGDGDQEPAKPSEKTETPSAGPSTPPTSVPVSAQAQSLPHHHDHQQQQYQQQQYEQQQYQSYQEHHQQYLYQPEAEAHSMVTYDPRPQSMYQAPPQHQSHYSPSVPPAFTPYSPTPQPPVMMPQMTEQYGYVAPSPMGSVATTANGVPDDGKSVCSPLNTYVQSYPAFSPDFKALKVPGNEYAQATSPAQHEASGESKVFIPPMTSAPGNPQFVPPPPASASGGGGAAPQLYPEPGPSNEKVAIEAE